MAPMASRTNIDEATYLVDRSAEFMDSDGARAVALAAHAQVYATLALVDAVENLTETLHTSPERMVDAIEAADRDASERTSRAIKDAARHA